MTGPAETGVPAAVPAPSPSARGEAPLIGVFRSQMCQCCASDLEAAQGLALSEGFSELQWIAWHEVVTSTGEDNGRRETSNEIFRTTFSAKTIQMDPVEVSSMS